MVLETTSTTSSTMPAYDATIATEQQLTNLLIFYV